MSTSRKRKYSSSGTSQSYSPAYTTGNHSSPPKPDHTLYIQAYEADLIRGPHAYLTAQSLEITRLQTKEQSSSQASKWKIGDGLIKWGGEKPTRNQRKSAPAFIEDDDDELWNDDEQNAVWVDRFDARLLLDSLPQPNPHASPPPDSPTGWSDLPSDTEDTFFLSPEEADDFRRDKRRRLMDRNREERLKALQAEDEEDDTFLEEELWGGSDEEPDDQQTELMHRTATHISSSPNPAQLEMRILANHGGDKRFAFLRGRWSRAWKKIKLKVRHEKEEECRKSAPGLGDLAAYGDSDGDSEEGRRNEELKEASVCERHDSPAEVPMSEEVIKEARRARAREWAQKRRIL